MCHRLTRALEEQKLTEAQYVWSLLENIHLRLNLSHIQGN